MLMIFVNKAVWVFSCLIFKTAWHFDVLLKYYKIISNDNDKTCSMQIVKYTAQQKFSTDK